MKAKSIFNVAMGTVLCLALVYACKKKENESPSTSSTTTTGGSTTTGGGTTSSTNYVTISGGATYQFDSLQVGGYTATTQTYRQRGLKKSDLNTGLIIDMYGSTAATIGTYTITNIGYNSGQAYMSLAFPNGSGGWNSVIGTSGSLIASTVNGKFTTTFNNAVFQSSGGWPVTSYTVSGSITNP